MKGDLPETIVRLQRKAAHCAWLFQTSSVRPSLQVLFVSGSDIACPWRLFEIHKSKDQVVTLRRMHCYDSADVLNRSLDERVLWKARDRALITARVPQAGRLGRSSALSALQKPGTALSSAEKDLARLEPERKALRASICVTRATRVVDLPLKALSPTQ